MLKKILLAASLAMMPCMVAEAGQSPKEIHISKRSKHKAYKQILDILSKSEGAHYNTIYGGKRVSLTKMRIIQVLRLQKIHVANTEEERAYFSIVSSW